MTIHSENKLFKKKSKKQTPFIGVVRIRWEKKLGEERYMDKKTFFG